jgi:sec-independent protein translocase protein TatA
VEHHPAFVLGIGMPHGFEWIVILVAMLLIFGKRLPEIMRGLGGSVKEFKKGMDEGPKPEVPPVPPVSAPPPATVSRDWVPPNPNLAAPMTPLAPTTPLAPNTPTAATPQPAAPPAEPK